MQYKSITYKRAIVPKPYESKTLEVTVELNEGDEPELVARLLMADVEEILQTAYEYLDTEHLTTTVNELKKARTFNSALKNLDEIHF